MLQAGSLKCLCLKCPLSHSRVLIFQCEFTHYHTEKEMNFSRQIRLTACQIRMKESHSIIAQLQNIRFIQLCLVINRLAEFKRISKMLFKPRV